VLEYANKRNLKAMVRWWSGRQHWSPFEKSPVEFVELNFDFHPDWMSDRLREACLDCQQQLAVSHFRLPWFKRFVSVQWLARFDEMLAGIGGHYPVSPSVFVQTRRLGADDRASVETTPTQVHRLFRCPECYAEDLAWQGEHRLQCTACGACYARKNGIWDFKEKLGETSR
jgi:ribosomal protein L37AE/L43A